MIWQYTLSQLAPLQQQRGDVAQMVSMKDSF
jgi:hypothetical protein